MITSGPEGQSVKYPPAPAPGLMFLFPTPASSLLSGRLRGPVAHIQSRLRAPCTPQATLRRDPLGALHLACLSSKAERGPQLGRLPRDGAREPRAERNSPEGSTGSREELGQSLLTHSSPSSPDTRAQRGWGTQGGPGWGLSGTGGSDRAAA